MGKKQLDPKEFEYEIVSYLRKKKPPSLKQFLIRKKVQELMKEKHATGFDYLPDGRPVPKLASELKNSMKGMSAEKIAKEHPEWVNEYNKSF